METKSISLLFIINYLTFIQGQGLLPSCPPCQCNDAKILTDENQNSGRVSDLLNLPSHITSLKEGFKFIKTRLQTDKPYRYIAENTLMEIDRVIDDTIDSTPKVAVFMEAVAGHILDAVLPGSSSLIDGIKFMLSMIRSNTKDKVIYKSTLDPLVQKELINSIASMLEAYDNENPGCLRQSTTPHANMVFNNFLYTEGVCPTIYDIEDSERNVVLADIRLQAPIDFSRLMSHQLLFRGVISVTFDNKFTMRLSPSYLEGFDVKSIVKLFALHGLSTNTNSSAYNLLTYFDPEDIGVLTGDQFSLCLQEKLFTQMRLDDLKFYYTSPIPYSPKTFSKDQMNVRRPQCTGINSNSCIGRICSKAGQFMELLHSINNLPFATNIKRSKRTINGTVSLPNNNTLSVN